MRWEGNRESDNVEDRRGDGGGGGGFPIGGRSIGIGTVVLALIGWGVFGINPLTTIGVLSGGGSPQVQQAPAHRPAGDDQGAKFVSTVLASTEDVWTQIFREGGAQYQNPKLVLFTGVTRTACGTGQSAMGPFYCPGDYKVYLDMDFFNTMSRAPGAAGRLPGRHLGQQVAAGQELAGAGRYRVGDECRTADRRRQAAARSHGHGASRQLYPWLQRPACALVHPGLQDRQRQGLRYLRSSVALSHKLA